MGRKDVKAASVDCWEQSVTFYDLRHANLQLFYKLKQLSKQAIKGQCHQSDLESSTLKTVILHVSGYAAPF